MNRKARFFVAGLALVGAVAYLMYTGVSQTSVYYLTIGEFITKKEGLANEGVRVAGRVALGSVRKNMTPNGEELNFRIGDFQGNDSPDQPTVPVHYVGVVPDMFKAAGGSDVIIEGKYRDGTLQAQNVLTSCPSKYEAKAAGEAAAK
ncbi:MAG: cytochrome c maturation protein CcmE [Deltaproteobacteria bacterium]|nr:cytochrome c maturation protein CcmE [Planctomycetota bacterium]MBI3782899.1 cytochrome c maturation protein CcmE [Deltaproteobacteria bacterium]